MANNQPIFSLKSMGLVKIWHLFLSVCHDELVDELCWLWGLSVCWLRYFCRALGLSVCWVGELCWPWGLSVCWLRDFCRALGLSVCWVGDLCLVMFGLF